MSSDLVRFSIAIPENLLNQFDEYTAERGLLVNRSEAIRSLIRDALVERELDNPGAQVAGTITIMYDHHTPDLVRKIADVQHTYPDEVVSSMHVHLDEDACMETIAVRGLSRRVHELANCLLGIKGITFGKLTTAVVGAERRGE